MASASHGRRLESVVLLVEARILEYTPRIRTRRGATRRRPSYVSAPHLWPTSFSTLSRRRRAIRFGLPSSPARDVLVPHRGDEEFKNPGAAYLWRFRPSFQLFRLHILSYNSPISRFCPSGDASYGEWAIKPDGR